MRLRIIGGRFRGRKLSFPESADLRPTPDRVRETLFNWLMHDIEGAHCLDLFAGSGLLGFEAASRGASQVTLVEMSGRVAQALQENVAALGDPPMTVVKDNALAFLAHTTETYTLIFMDPPFRQALWQPCLDLVRTRDLLAPEGRIYVEYPRHQPLDFSAWTVVKAKTMGRIAVALLA